MFPVSRITGEGRAELLRAWGHGFEQDGAGWGGRGDGRGKSFPSTSLKVINVKV